jgi:NAD(P)-dependent dehydrogenase (short-subunit alcohol dehydrogenase family)
MTGRLDGIHTLITGAASGIGAACARRMARDGAQLLLADQNGDGAKSLADELGQASVQADYPCRGHPAYARFGVPALGTP